MAAIPIGLIAAAAAPELLKIGSGLISNKRSEEYAKKARPKYEIPQAYQEYLAAAKFRAGTYGFPGQGKTEAKLARQSAASARAIERSGQSAASKIAGLAALDQASKEQVAELGIQAARQDERDLQQMYEAQRLMGTEQRRQWEWDKRGPYENAMLTAARLQEASQQAIFTGLEGLSGIAQSAIGLDKIKKKNKEEKKVVFNQNTSMPGSYGIEENPTAQIKLPNQITNGFNSQYYGMPITNEMSDYYGMNDNFNRLFNSLFV